MPGEPIAFQKWIPNDEVCKFWEARATLLSRYTVSQVRRRLRHVEHKGFLPTNTPSEVVRAIDWMVYGRHIASLSEEEWIERHHGKVVRADIERGAKVLRAARRGHEAVHGTKEQRRRRWQEWQTAIDKLRGQFLGYSHNKLCEIASAELGVSDRTLRQRTR